MAFSKRSVYESESRTPNIRKSRSLKVSCEVSCQIGLVITSKPYSSCSSVIRMFSSYWESDFRTPRHSHFQNTAHWHCQFLWRKILSYLHKHCPGLLKILYQTKNQSTRQSG